ncbi:MAG: hypothetical protein MJ175_13050 [Clostridia bacterium]|nr:hypothetical protein [Clostridia bacterium]
MLIGRLLAKRSRNHNRSIPIEGYIRDQSIAPVRYMKYGTAHMNYNGCEVIATYNALISLDTPMPLAEIAEAYSKSGLWFFGIFGTWPAAIPRFFRRRGYRVTMYSKHRFREADDPTLIYTYWNPRFRGIHTVELHKTPKGYTVLNLRPLMGRYFPTPAAAIRMIKTPLPLRLTGLRHP